MVDDDEEDEYLTPVKKQPTTLENEMILYEFACKSYTNSDPLPFWKIYEKVEFFNLYI